MTKYCMQFVGVNYLWGGDDPLGGFDCSGFAQEFLKAFGAHPKPQADLTAQGLYSELCKSGQNQVKETGSLAFYGTSYNKITHVAILLDRNHIFEFGGGGSSTIDKEAAQKQNAYGRIRPLTNRKDLVAVIMPKYLRENP